MGARSITGEFITSDPYKRLMEESFNAQVQSNYDWYAGDIGTIHTFKKDEAIKRDIFYNKIELSLHFKRFMQEHPECKEKEKLIQYYLMNEISYLNKGELVYLVDYSTPCGYGIGTYGGKKEVSISQLPEECKRYINPSEKGYTLFNLTHKKDGLLVSVEPCEEGLYYCRNTIIFKTLNEAEDKIKKDIVNFRKYYFLIKNDGTKAYMYYPNVKYVKTTNRKTDSKNYTVRVDEAYPVYYAGMAAL